MSALQCIAFCTALVILLSMGAVTKAVAYVRVSTDKQADKGQSLEVQQAKVAQYAALYDLELVEVIVDAGYSASTLDRPGLQRALAMLRAREVSGLLVTSLDRLTRDVGDLGELVKTYFAAGKFNLLSVGEQIDTRTAGGRLVLNVIGSVAQWERERIAERMKEGKKAKRAKGGFIGGAAPRGFKLAAEGKLAPVESEQVAVAAARALRASGLSLRQVAAELDRLGHGSRSGRAFSAEQVRRMVAAPSEVSAA